MASPPQEKTSSSPDLSRDAEMTPPHAPIYAYGAGDESILYDVPVMFDDPKISGAGPFDVPPLRMIPFGGKEPVPFSKQELERFREHKLLASSREQEAREAPIPHKLESHALYVKGDWKAFVQIRSDGHKDWTYAHKGYRRKFRSLHEVDQFLTYTKGVTDIFNGRRLQKMKTEDSEGHGPGVSKSTGGRNALKSSSATKVLNCPNRQISPEKPPGFL